MHYNKNVTHGRQKFWLLIKSFGNDADAIIPVRLAAPTTIGGGLSIMKLSIKRAFAIDQALYAYFADRNRTVIKGGAAI